MSGFAVVLLKVQNRVYLMTGADNKVMSFTDIVAAALYFGNGIRQASASSYEGSMSGCIFMMTFQPRVMYFYTEKDVVNILPVLPNGNVGITHLNNISGNMRGIELKPEFHKLWLDAVEPIW